MEYCLEGDQGRDTRPFVLRGRLKNVALAHLHVVKKYDYWHVNQQSFDHFPILQTKSLQLRDKSLYASGCRLISTIGSFL
jgi:hypothetical protein